MCNGPEKLCLFCEHCYLSLGYEWYSDETPGGPGYVECYKEHFADIDSEGTNKIKLAEIVLKARTCPDFMWSSLIKRGEQK